MALAERLTNPRPAPRHGTPCSLGSLIAQLDGAELDALGQMLGTPENWGWPAGDIYDALIAEGYKVSLQQINRHRGGKCRCPKVQS